MRIGALFLNPLTIFKRTFKRSHHLGSFCAGAVERTAFDQAFDHALVDFFQINPFAEIKQRFKWLIRATGDDGFNRAFTDIFYGHQPEADAGSIHRKLDITFIDIRRQDRDIVMSAFGDKFHHTVGGIHFAGQQGCHDLHRKMCF